MVSRVSGVAFWSQWDSLRAYMRRAYATRARQQRAGAALRVLLGLSVLVACSAQRSRLRCDTQLELYENLAYVRNTCEQVNETFADVQTPVPLTCKSPACHRTIRQVAEDCDGLLQSSAWYTTWRNYVQAAVARCVASSSSAIPAAGVYPVQDPGRAQPITACAGTVSDGNGEYGNNWQRLAIIDAGPGQKAHLTVETLGLADGDRITVYDGPTPKCRQCQDHRKAQLGQPLLGKVLPKARK